MTIVKICGLMDKESVLAADKADYAGFVVGSGKSHRNITLKEFTQLRKYLTNAKPVLVTVNHSMKFLHKLRSQENVIIQLHGKARKFAEIIQNSAIGLNFEEYNQCNFQIQNRFSFFVVDKTKLDGYGGTGENWEWKEISKNNNLQNSKILVAGGINVENVEVALKQTKAEGVDVSSSLEINGKKSPEKIRQFISKVRNL